MKQRTFVIVYQAGIANVFSLENGTRARVYQGDFQTAEALLHGMWLAGARCLYSFCNQAGDIAAAPWDTPEEHAPFIDIMRVPKAYAAYAAMCP